ncbi:hypothetical protein C8J57DRAFT_1223867 [Mycena rebaudengoi]|nr:hypothetical protein C8J57DRAFT_1223867 [Mycena rebaudengoi]
MPSHDFLRRKRLAEKIEITAAGNSSIRWRISLIRPCYLFLHGSSQPASVRQKIRESRRREWAAKIKVHGVSGSTGNVHTHRHGSKITGGARSTRGWVVMMMTNSLLDEAAPKNYHLTSGWNSMILWVNIYSKSVIQDPAHFPRNMKREISVGFRAGKWRDFFFFKLEEKFSCKVHVQIMAVEVPVQLGGGCEPPKNAFWVLEREDGCAKRFAPQARRFNRVILIREFKPFAWGGLNT